MRTAPIRLRTGAAAAGVTTLVAAAVIATP